MAKSRDFPGTAGNNISITDPTGVVVDAAWTFGCWINPDTTDATRTILRVGAGGDTTRGFNFYHTDTGVPRWRQGGSLADGPVTAIGTAAWHTLGVTKAGAGVAVIAFSRDGASIGSNNMDPPTEIAAGDVFRIGDNVGGLGLSPIDAEMAYAFWLQGVALSAAATDSYLNNPASLITDYGPSGTVTANALKIFWPMQCDTATEEDKSGVGNNGTRTGTVTLEITGPTPTTAYDPCTIPVGPVISASIGPTSGAGTATGTLTSDVVLSGTNGAVLLITLTSGAVTMRTTARPATP